MVKSTLVRYYIVNLNKLFSEHPSLLREIEILYCLHSFYLIGQVIFVSLTVGKGDGELSLVPLISDMKS